MNYSSIFKNLVTWYIQIMGKMAAGNIYKKAEMEIKIVKNNFT